MKKNVKNLIFLCLLHFSVDFVCASSLMFIYDVNALPNILPYVFLIYNCLAFLLQPIFGLLIDRFDGSNNGRMYKAFLLISLGSLLIGWVLSVFTLTTMSSIFMMLVSSIVLGLSNALFHVVGGKQSLMFSNKATPGGLFVSTGALGIGLASVMFTAGYGSIFIQYLYFAMPAIILIFGLLSFFSKFEVVKGEYGPYSFKSIKWFSIAVLLLCVAIAVRSFLGFYNKMSEGIVDWVSIFLLSVSAFMGKAIGGILLDLGGPFFTIGVSTILSTVLSIFLSHSYVDYIYILSFNLLMPVTLDALRRCFPNKEGFAFGLAAAFLIPGYLLGSILKPYGPKEIIIPIVCFITGAMLVFVYLINKKAVINERDK